VQLRQAFALGITVVRRISRSFRKHIEKVVWRGQVRVTDAERNNIDAFGTLCGDAATDISEKVGGQLVDAFRESHGTANASRASGSAQSLRTLAFS
jgi:hypothetical protein